MSIAGWIDWPIGLLGSAIALAGFIAAIVYQAAKTQQLVKELRKTAKPGTDPNTSILSRKLAMQDSAQRQWRGRCYRSSITLLGLPLLDIQVDDLRYSRNCTASPRTKVARGWIAMGNRADGILLAIGGRARGLVAIGGIAVGLVSLGGCTVGLLSAGGMAVGGLAVGGIAVGYQAFGGMGLGYDVAAGVALGWHSAVGGLAIAKHAAHGGLAIAREFAVGGLAIAADQNNEIANKMIEQETWKGIIDWQIRNPIVFLVGIWTLSLFPAILGILARRLMYVSTPAHTGDDATANGPPS
jgi:hypothetical protein